MNLKPSVIARFMAVSSVYLLAAIPPAATAQTSISTSTAAGANSAIPPLAASSPAAQKLIAGFSGFAGSAENAASLVSGLRSGSRITLTPVAPTVSPGGVAGTSFVPPTRAMGWGNVRHALTLAQRELAAQGINQPTPSQLRAALMGGAVTTSAGRMVTLQGTLPLRSQGMGWGHIARAVGVRMGHAESLELASRHQPHHVATSGHRSGTVTTASGAIVRSSHWSGAASQHARVGAGATALAARSGGAGTLPAAATPSAAAFGLRSAADHGGLGGSSHWRAR